MNVLRQLWANFLAVLADIAQTHQDLRREREGAVKRSAERRRRQG